MVLPTQISPSIAGHQIQPTKPQMVSSNGTQTKTSSNQEKTRSSKSSQPNTVIQAMNSLHFFPKGNKNCYNLPLFTQYYKLLFRTGFYYIWKLRWAFKATELSTGY
ncbi:hypothetical protein ACSBR2_032894 [Camellia fascicularis]